jgi:hypothetical protein
LVEIEIRPDVATKASFEDVLDLLSVLTEVEVGGYSFVFDPKRPPRGEGTASPLPAAAVLPAFPGEPRPGFNLLSERSLPIAGKDGARYAQAVDHALRWLASHQSADGRWECSGFTEWCNGSPAAPDRKPAGAGNPRYDVGATALALCTFLGDGRSDGGNHEYAETVRRGLRWLVARQDGDGCFPARETQHYVYEHALATLAMVEAYGLTGSLDWMRSAQKGLDFIAQARNPFFAWRYGIKPGDNDTSVSAWMVSALCAARRVNERSIRSNEVPVFDFDEGAFEGFRAWLDKMTDPESGRVGYMSRGSGPARPVERFQKFPPEKSESMTAVGVYLRVVALGEDPKKGDLVRKGADRMIRLLPTWNDQDGSIDMYYWFYGTLAMYQMGGTDWDRWNSALQTSVLANQRMDTDPCQYKGSWDPADLWGVEGGRIYSTALCTMCLQAAKRQERIFPSK